MQTMVKEKFDNIDDYMWCSGCETEIWECYYYQQMKGYSSGLEFAGNHLAFFVIDNKTKELIVYLPNLSSQKETFK